MFCIVEVLAYLRILRIGVYGGPGFAGFVLDEGRLDSFDVVAEGGEGHGAGEAEEVQEFLQEERGAVFVHAAVQPRVHCGVCGGRDGLQLGREGGMPLDVGFGVALLEARAQRVHGVVLVQQLLQTFQRGLVHALPLPESGGDARVLPQGGGPDAIELAGLQMEGGERHAHVQPLGMHLVHHRARLPVPIVRKRVLERQQERERHHHGPDGVRVAQPVVVARHQEHIASVENPQ
mmetsp:Transcript_15555/g.23017  ORF Transcript_15555/g.23017 Transcript_15555/m.23017 type:complete len:234 (-) Transcript_15555:183-884(-)